MTTGKVRYDWLAVFASFAAALLVSSIGLSLNPDASAMNRSPHSWDSASAVTPFPVTPDRPNEVEFLTPEMGKFEEDLPSFARFAWQNFIALNWPAHPAELGLPNKEKQLGDPARKVVWQTWKTMHEVFPADVMVNPPKGWGLGWEAWMPQRPKLVDV